MPPRRSKPEPPTITPLLVSFEDAQRLLSLSRGTVHRLVQEGLLRSSKIGFRRLVLFEDVQRLAHEGADCRAPRIGLDKLREQERASKEKIGTVTPVRRRRRQFQEAQPAIR